MLLSHYSKIKSSSDLSAHCSSSWVIGSPHSFSLNFIRNSLNLHTLLCTCWTDSTIVLTWLRSHSSRWNTFVANRVSQIQSNAPAAVWRYVPTACNPADCASRGLSGDDLVNHNLWWFGPSWLRLDRTEWPSESEISLDESPIEEKIHAIHAFLSNPQWDLADKFSSWSKLICVTGYIYKFVYACRRIGLDSNEVSFKLLFLSPKFCSLAKAF